MSWLGMGSSAAGAGAGATAAVKGAAQAGGLTGTVGSALSAVPKETLATAGGSGFMGLLEKGGNAIMASQQASSLGDFDALLKGGGGDAKAQQPKSDKILGLIGLGFDDTHLKMQQKAESSVPDMLSMFGMR